MRIVLFSRSDCSIEMTGDEDHVRFTVRAWTGDGDRAPMNLPVVGRFAASAAELVHQINLVTDAPDTNFLDMETEGGTWHEGKFTPKERP
jgi:hypothetical protein